MQDRPFPSAVAESIREQREPAAGGVQSRVFRKVAHPYPKHGEPPPSIITIDTIDSRDTTE